MNLAAKIVLPPQHIQAAFQALQEDVLNTARRHLVDCTVFPISTDILWEQLSGLSAWIDKALARSPSGSSAFLMIRMGVLQLEIREERS